MSLSNGIPSIGFNRAHECDGQTTYALRLVFFYQNSGSVRLDPSTEFFGDVRPANRIFRPIFGQPQISRPITASVFFRRIFGLFRN